MFRIRHYAGPVEYNIRGFIEKNRDRFEGSLAMCFGKSTVPLLKKLGQQLDPAVREQVSVQMHCMMLSTLVQTVFGAAGQELIVYVGDIEPADQFLQTNPCLVDGMAWFFAHHLNNESGTPLCFIIVINYTAVSPSCHVIP